MVGIFTGSGVGIDRGSASVLGRMGLLGEASLGRGGDKVYVNGSTGNLVIDRQDEVLIGRGPDQVYSLTYNSRADPSFPWQMGTQRLLHSLRGSVNSAGMARLQSAGRRRSGSWARSSA